jgi:cytoskeletal protein CcmA (bactofilin family)
MADNRLSSEDAYINSIVGEGTHFRGHLDLSGLLRIDGDFSGSIKTSGKVIIGRNGRADCTIEAGTVVVGGVLRGSIYAAETVIVLSSALVLADIHAPRLVAEDGVLLDGVMEISGAGERAPMQGRTRKKRPFLLFSEVQQRRSGAQSPEAHSSVDGHKELPVSGRKE